MSDDFLAEVFAYLILGLAGYILGGIIGEFFFSGWSPASWFGLAVAWGIPLCIHADISDHHYD